MIPTIASVQIVTSLGSIEYWFVGMPERVRYHKVVHHFLMKPVGGDLAEPIDHLLLQADLTAMPPGDRDARLQDMVQTTERRLQAAGVGDVTIQTCWDADRLDLSRVGIRPDPKKLCTKAAKDPAMISWAYERSITRHVPSILIEWEKC